MDATSLYPQGFHPVRLDQLPHNLRRSAPIRSRADVTVTYYLVDFGISSWFQPSDTDRLVLGTSGLDEDVPELSDDVPYDPFKVDVFVLGNFFRQHFTGVSATFVLVAYHGTNPRVRNLQICPSWIRWFTR